VADIIPPFREELGICTVQHQALRLPSQGTAKVACCSKYSQVVALQAENTTKFIAKVCRICPSSNCNVQGPLPIYNSEKKQGMTGGRK
jgi:predicted transcriptional regulator